MNNDVNKVEDEIINNTIAMVANHLETDSLNYLKGYIDARIALLNQQKLNERRNFYKNIKKYYENYERMEKSIGKGESNEEV